jgi:cyclopropane fatty-acyl-phospholipid synthase-like methyltransferase
MTQVEALYDKGEEFLARLWDENFHYGYWSGPDDCSPVAEATERLTDLVLGELDVPAGGTVLDVGCGIGKPAVRLAREHGVDVTGISVSAAEVAKANARAAAQDPPFGDSSFDGVLAFQSMMHMPDRAKVLQQIARLLRPGGALVVTDFYRAAPLTDAGRAAMAAFARIFYVNDTLYDMAEYRSLLTGSGFAVEQVLEVPDSRCKAPTLQRLAAAFGAARDEIEKVFPPAVVDAMVGACRGFAATPQCAYLVGRARRLGT